MPFDPNAWKRAALAHYLELARLPVPGAVATAIGLAAAAEFHSAGALAGLADKVRERTADSRTEQPNELRTPRQGEDSHRRNAR